MAGSTVLERAHWTVNKGISSQVSEVLKTLNSYPDTKSEAFLPPAQIGGSKSKNEKIECAELARISALVSEHVSLTVLSTSSIAVTLKISGSSLKFRSSCQVAAFVYRVIVFSGSRSRIGTNVIRIQR